jgi:hypothetical protein
VVQDSGNEGGVTVSDQASPRQVLYALVSGGFLLVVLALTIGAAVAGLVPLWWTAVMLTAVVVSGVWGGFNWSRTGALLMGSISLFVLWTVGTLILAG